MTGSIRPGNRPESGSALVLAIVLMVGVVLIAVSSMEITVTHAIRSDDRGERLAFVILTESAIDLGYQRLAADPAFRGTFAVSTSSGASVDITIADIGGGIEIAIHDTSSSSLDGGVTAFLEPVSTTPAIVDRPVEIGGTMTLNGGSMTIDNTLRHQGSLSLISGAVFTGPTEAQPVSGYSLDQGAFEAVATQVEYGDYTLTPGSYHFDALRVDGSLVLQGPIDVSGSIYVTGSFEVQGNAQPVNLAPVGQRLDLIVDGGGLIDDASALELRGMFVVEGNLAITNTPSVNGFGGLYTLGSASIADATTNWVTDLSVMGDLIGANGLPIVPGAITYVEAWRRTAITIPSTEPGDGPGGPGGGKGK